MPDPNLEMLLKRLRLLPVPEAPVPADLGPLDLETARAFAALNPEPTPPRYAEPAPDVNFANQYAGAAPTAPAPLSRGQRIANALMGFGAGIQGQGAQFLDQLREPQREYQRQVERYEGRRAQGQAIAESRAEREADRANRAAEAQYEREYKIWLKKMDIRQDEADTRTKHAFDLLKIREVERIADEKQAAQQAQQNKIKLAELTSKYRQAGAKQYAGELAQKDLDPGYKLSPGAEKWESARVALEQARANRLAGLGGGTGGGGISKQTAKLVEEFNTVRLNLITAYQNNDAKGKEQLRMRINSLVRRLAGRPGIEAGYGAGNWPYIKVNGVLSTGEEQQQPQAQGKTITRAEMQTLGVTEEQVKAEGFTITP